MKVAFKAPNEIGKKFPFKDNIKEIQEQSLVVYKINRKHVMRYSSEKLNEF